MVFGGGGEYSTLERLTPTNHGRLRRVILEVYAATAVLLYQNTEHPSGPANSGLEQGREGGM